MTEKIIYVKGMQCVSCEELITQSLNDLDSVKAKASFTDGKVVVKYDENKISLDKIEKEIEKGKFKVIKGKSDKVDIDTVLKYFILIFGLNYLGIHLLGINIIGSVFSVISNLVSNVPVIDENTGFLFLFIIGALTSFHCVAMCGGINVTQCLTFKEGSNKSPNLMYNLGRVTSYTVLGGIIGLIGSVISLSVSTQALMYVFVGFFMVLMGLNLYGINIGRKLLPKMPKKFRNLNKNGNAPFVVGLLNGLMPCGPLQSMQLYALSTGSFVTGALSMFFFSVGTVPLMYLFGKIGDFKNPNIAKKFMKVSAVLVLVLGIVMANRGLSLLGFGTNISSSSANNSASQSSGITATMEGDVQVINTDLSPRRYPDIVVKKDVPVKFVINATSDTLTGCNNEIIINEYGIDKKLTEGENVIEFTPTEVGTYRYSCWMGMIRATITVVE